jgi:proteasome lid subunit RPN8/RPN11
MVVPGQALSFVFRTGSVVVHEETVDCNVLFHDVAFSAVCSGRLPNSGGWEPLMMEPELVDGRIHAVTVSVAGVSRTYGRAVFRDRAVEILLTKGLLRDQDAEDRVDEIGVSWDLETCGVPGTPGRLRSLATVRQRAYPLARRPFPQSEEADRSGKGHFSIWISSELIDELREECRTCLDRERADFLAGDLVQGPHGRVAAILKSRVPAEKETGSSLVHFSFSAETFQAAESELRRRGSDQVLLGWAHNHPPPCGRTCLMTVPPCRTDNVSFSLQDRIVHRSAFGRPYMVGVVSGKGAGRRADDPVIRAYGWRRGRICERRLATYRER